MCGVGALRLQTGIQERDILYLCCENQVDFTYSCCTCTNFIKAAFAGLQCTILCVS